MLKERLGDNKLIAGKGANLKGLVQSILPVLASPQTGQPGNTASGRGGAGAGERRTGGTPEEPEGGTA